MSPEKSGMISRWFLRDAQAPSALSFLMEKISVNNLLILGEISTLLLTVLIFVL